MNTNLTRGEQARQFYNAAASTAADFSFMNYGFAPLSRELAASQEPERYCLQLYRHLLGKTNLTGRRVVEVSCGRGGGAAHLASAYKPAEYIGIDISDENVRLASERFSKVANLRFKVGNAEQLPLAAGSCHAVVNVEAAHLYDNPAKFFSEVLRVLENGGTFFYADLAWADKDPEQLITAAGFTIESVEDITANVLQSLDADSQRREEIVASFPAPLQNDFRDWSGVKGHRAYNRFKSGEWVYRAIRAVG
jgi:ubiquinone/menaquinone biosynthesis C-methylase UbiE